jgi:hypothetical protein
VRTHDEGRSVINGQRIAYKPGKSVGDMYAEMAARENKKSANTSISIQYA